MGAYSLVLQQRRVCQTGLASFQGSAEIVSPGLHCAADTLGGHSRHIIVEAEVCHLVDSRDNEIEVLLVCGIELRLSGVDEVVCT